MVIGGRTVMPSQIGLEDAIMGRFPNATLCTQAALLFNALGNFRNEAIKVSLQLDSCSLDACSKLPISPHFCAHVSQNGPAHLPEKREQRTY